MILYAPLGDVRGTPGVVFVCLQTGRSNAAAGGGEPRRCRSGYNGARKTHVHGAARSVAYGTITSLGCIGNRVYTGLGEDEMYVVLRGQDLAEVVEALKTIRNANAALEDYGKGRRQQLSTM